MPITTTIDNGRELTIHTVAGEAFFEEGMSILRRSWENQPTKYSLWDFSEATLVRLTNDELKQIIDYIMPQGEKRAGGKTMIVGSKELVDRGKKVMETLNEIKSFPFQIELFKSIEEAHQWMDQED